MGNGCSKVGSCGASNPERYIAPAEEKSDVLSRIEQSRKAALTPKIPENSPACVPDLDELIAIKKGYISQQRAALAQEEKIVSEQKTALAIQSNDFIAICTHLK